MALVLRNWQGNKNAYKTLIAAEYCGVKVERKEEVEMGDCDQTHLFLKNPVFVDRNRVGEVPVLETPDGLIVESNAMARYVALAGDDMNLCGSTVYELAKVEDWIAFASTELDAVLTRWVYLRVGVYPSKARSEQILTAFAKRVLRVLDSQLAPDYDYLACDSLTLADIVVICDLYYGFTHVMAKSFTRQFPHVERYFWKLVNQPNFKKVLGEVEQAKEVMPADKIFLDKKTVYALSWYRTNHKVELANEGIELAALDDGCPFELANEVIEPVLVLFAGALEKRYAYNTLITAEYCGVEVKYVNATSNLSLLETPYGPVVGRNAMTRFIARLTGLLYTSSIYEYAQIEEWMQFAVSEIDRGLRRWIYPTEGVAPCDPHHSVEMRRCSVHKALGFLNTHLTTNSDYLVGNCLTLADIEMTCALHFGFTRVMTKTFTSEFPNVERYFWKLVNEPNFKKYFGEVKQANNEPKFKKYLGEVTFCSK